MAMQSRLRMRRDILVFIEAEPKHLYIVNSWDLVCVYSSCPKHDDLRLHEPPAGFAGRYGIALVPNGDTTMRSSVARMPRQSGGEASCQQYELLFPHITNPTIAEPLVARRASVGDPSRGDPVIRRS